MENYWKAIKLIQDFFPETRRASITSSKEQHRLLHRQHENVCLLLIAVSEMNYATHEVAEIASERVGNPK